jgi:hypothetical protein
VLIAQRPKMLNALCSLAMFHRICIPPRFGRYERDRRRFRTFRTCKNKS